VRDDVIARLLIFSNVIVTVHQAFFTRNAPENIAETTLSNIAAFERGEALANAVTVVHVLG
jgi:D-lactate dehydrogenase